MIFGALMFSAASARASTIYFPTMPGTPGTSVDNCASGKCASLFASKRFHWVHGGRVAGRNITCDHDRGSDDRTRCNVR